MTRNSTKPADAIRWIKYLTKFIPLPIRHFSFQVAALFYILLENATMGDPIIKQIPVKRGGLSGRLSYRYFVGHPELILFLYSCGFKVYHTKGRMNYTFNIGLGSVNEVRVIYRHHGHFSH